MRHPIVAGNWKMHLARPEAAKLAAEVAAGLGASESTEVVLCPPFTSLAAVADELRGSRVSLGAQNVYWAADGAFTGETSASMLCEVGCRYVIVGHSERRTLFGETDEQVSLKARAVLASGMRPIVCIGETLAERERGTTESVLRRQLEAGLGELGAGLGDLVIAYEPVWAIGTGKTASPEQVQAAHAFVRGVLAELAGPPVADAVRIQYGGSVKPGNARELFALPDVDGGLIGGASLEVGSFLSIVGAG